jgi:hypothetical protein
VAGCDTTGDAATAGSPTTVVDGVVAELFVSSLTAVAADEMLPASTDSAGLSVLLLSLLLMK